MSLFMLRIIYSNYGSNLEIAILITCSSFTLDRYLVTAETENPISHLGAKSYYIFQSFVG